MSGSTEFQVFIALIQGPMGAMIATKQGLAGPSLDFPVLVAAANSISDVWEKDAKERWETRMERTRNPSYAGPMPGSMQRTDADACQHGTPWDEVCDHCRTGRP